jgi:hypothetical protein
MSSFLKFFRKPSFASRMPSPRSFRPGIEALECRQLLSITTLSGLAVPVRSTLSVHNGDLIALCADGNLFERTRAADPSSWVQIDKNVAQIATAANGDLVVRETNGNVYEQEAPRAVNLPLIDNNVAQIATAANGDLVVVETNGNVYEQVASRAVNLALIGTSAILAPDGSTWFLGKATVDSAGDHAIYRISNGEVGQMPGVGIRLSVSGGIVSVRNAAGGIILPDLGNGTGLSLQGGNLIFLTPQRTFLVLQNVQGMTPLGNGAVTVQVGPYLQADLSFQWTTGTMPVVGFLDVRLNAGALLGPAIAELQKVTRPLEGVAEKLEAPLPVLSTISQWAGQGPYRASRFLGDVTGNPGAAQQIDRFALAVEAINQLPPSPGDDWIDLGSFTAATGSGVSIVSTAARNAWSELGGLTASAAQQLEQQIGVSLPVLDDPRTLFRALAGQNVALFSYALPPVSISSRGSKLLWSYTFVVPPGIPVTVSVTANYSATVGAGATVGGDSSGLLAGNLAQGFFVQNAHADAELTLGLTGQASIGTGPIDVQGFHITSVSVSHLDLAASLHFLVHAGLTGADATGTVRGGQLLSGAARLAVSGSVSGELSGSLTYKWVDLSQVKEKVGETWTTVQDILTGRITKVEQDVMGWVNVLTPHDVTYTIFDRTTTLYTF